jgi:hypothetical protein
VGGRLNTRMVPSHSSSARTASPSWGDLRVSGSLTRPLAHSNAVHASVSVAPTETTGRRSCARCSGGSYADRVRWQRRRRARRSRRSPSRKAGRVGHTALVIRASCGDASATIASAGCRRQQPEDLRAGLDANVEDHG